MPHAKAPKNTPIPKDIVNFMKTTVLIKDLLMPSKININEGTGRDPVMAEVRHCILMGTALVMYYRSVAIL